MGSTYSSSGIKKLCLKELKIRTVMDNNTYQPWFNEGKKSYNNNFVRVYIFYKRSLAKKRGVGDKICESEKIKSAENIWFSPLLGEKAREEKN